MALISYKGSTRRWRKLRAYIIRPRWWSLSEVRRE